jgi:hypothetical protein
MYLQIVVKNRALTPIESVTQCITFSPLYELDEVTYIK